MITLFEHMHIIPLILAVTLIAIGATLLYYNKGEKLGIVACGIFFMMLFSMHEGSVTRNSKLPSEILKDILSKDSDQLLLDYKSNYDWKFMGDNAPEMRVPDVYLVKTHQLLPAIIVRKHGAMINGLNYFEKFVIYKRTKEFLRGYDEVKERTRLSERDLTTCKLAKQDLPMCAYSEQNQRKRYLSILKEYEKKCNDLRDKSCLESIDKIKLDNKLTRH